MDKRELFLGPIVVHPFSREGQIPFGKRVLRFVINAIPFVRQRPVSRWRP